MNEIKTLIKEMDAMRIKQHDLNTIVAKNVVKIDDLERQIELTANMTRGNLPTKTFWTVVAIFSTIISFQTGLALQMYKELAQVSNDISWIKLSIETE